MLKSVAYPYITINGKDFLVRNFGLRFHFNGKENDNEVEGDGNWQDYGMRMYSSRLGRFPSVDPLTSKYPMLTPYQFAGNMPIKYVDLDGLEPGNNPNTPGVKELTGMAIISTVASDASMNNTLTNPWAIVTNEKLEGTESKTGNNSYVTDTKGDPTNQFNMKVSNSTVFNVDESNANRIDNYELFVVNTLLKNFVSGTGPENYNFPTNGVISSQFLGSDILNAALSDFYAGNNVAKQYSFGAGELGKDFIRNGTLYSITGFTGSGNITITPNKDGIQIKIFNITSLTSGTYGKEACSETSCWPTSYVRDPNSSTPTTYGNISQTYNLFIPFGNK